MRRIFAFGRVASLAAATAAVFLFNSNHHAFGQLLDPGWQIVYAGPNALNSGPGGNMFADGAPPMVAPYQPAPMYYQPMPRAYQPGPTYYQIPQQRAYQPAPMYYQQAPSQPRAYQAAPTYYQQAPVQQPRYQQAPVYYQQPQMPQSRNYQQAPAYYQQAPAQQAQAYQPATRSYQQPAYQQPAYQQPAYQQPAYQQPGYQRATSQPQYYASASPQQARAAQVAPAQYAQPGQSLGAYQTGQSAQSQPAPAAYQPAVAQYRQPAPQPQQSGPFAFFLHTPQPAPPQGYASSEYAQPAYAPPGYAPSSYGNMAQQPADPRYDRQVVQYQGAEKPGTVIIDTPHYFLYLVLDGGQALRYGIGVGRPGFTWSGEKQISAMREWPDWYPPSDMLERRPDLPRYMPGGPDNPLGARALYLGSTLYRIHGSNEPWTIGTQVSSGCIRLRNEDVIDLYGRVKVGNKVIVI